MFKKALTGASVLVPGALVLLGTAAACTPVAAQKMSCSVLAVGQATQNGTASLHVSTAPASKVRAVLTDGSGTVVRSASSGASGVATLTIPVGNVPGPAQVLVSAVKGSQTGLCTTSFTVEPLTGTGNPVVTTCVPEIVAANPAVARTLADAPTQSSNITITSAAAGSPTCAEAEQLATLPSKVDASGSYTSPTGWTCTSDAAGTAGSTHYTCVSTSDAATSVTFDSSPLPSTYCGNVSSFVTNVREANTDCDTAKAVASVPANTWHTQGGPAAYSYSSPNGNYTCVQLNFADFQCFSSDYTRSVYWTPVQSS